MKWLLILSYLAAIVIANLMVAAIGPEALIVTGLILIPFDMISRDQLQEIWSGRGLKIRMFALILLGGIISYLLNRGAASIAIASCATFIVAGLADYVVYSYIKKSRFIKMVGSNVVSTTIDSLMFQIIAFGSFSLVIASQQTALKILGSIFWAFLFVYFLNKVKKD